MRPRILYITISLSLIGLLPSIYGVIFCNISEQLIERVTPIELILNKTIQEYRNSELTCQPPTYIDFEGNALTPEKVADKDMEIRSYCTLFAEKGFTAELSPWVDPTLKLGIEYTKSIKALRTHIFDLKGHLIHMSMGRKKIYCYLDDDIFVNALPLKEDIKAYYENILLKKYEERYGETLEQTMANAKVNYSKHIATLQEFLDKIKAARIAHEPHRPMIRFIGWAWLIFESIGMVLLFGTAYIELKKWREKRQSQRKH